MRRSSAFLAALSFGAALAALAAHDARADEPEPPPLTPETTPPIATTPESSPPPVLPSPVDEAPRPPPRRHGLVTEASLGALGFGGAFRHVAPTAYWMHIQIGYEPLSWLMIYADSELFFTDTSETQDPTQVRAFPVLGFGGGLRFTVHATERVALYLQGGVAALKADVPKNALAVLGFKNAEAFNPSFGGRLGVEWYQGDPHLALGLSAGLRDAPGFARQTAAGDTALLWDAGASIRYTF